MKSLNWPAIFLHGGVSKLEDVPKSPMPQIAIVGRSNVGKSSLLNHLARRKQLAKISKTAGKTRRLDFYLIPDQFFLVDLPGYGYAKVASGLKQKWSVLIDGYLADRRIKAVIFLVDGRHDPSKEDLQFWQWLAARDMPGIVVLTKCDKIKKNEKQKRFAKTAEILGVPVTRLIPYDIFSHEGRAMLDAAISEALWA